MASVAACALYAAAMPGAGAADGPGRTFVVTKPAEDVGDVDRDPGDGACATAAGECTLRAAVQEANALPGPQTIWLPPGEYTLLRGCFGEEAADCGDVDITGDLTIAGAGRGETSVSGKYGGTERIFDVHAPAVVAIRDLTVRDVFMSRILSFEEYCGGGIRNAGNLALQRVDLVNNVFRRSGGGMCNQGELSVADSTISGNQAGLVGRGGGILNEGVASIERVTMSDNIADTLGGGGIFNEGYPDGATLVVRDSAIFGNVSRYSGAGAGVGSDGAGAVATVVNSVISGNDAEANPSSNDYAPGGGVAAYDSARIILVNSTVSGNRASRPGGGLATEHVFASSPGSITLINTIVAGNENGDCAGLITSEGHNLDSDGTCGLTGEGDIPGVDPMLGPLADYGGSTQTHALLPGSPAIDAGGAGQCPDHDQRGAPRPFDGDGAGGPACDIGAYEFGAAVPPPPPPVHGDVDCSAALDALDALFILRDVAGLPPLAACLDLGDVNCDAAADAVDALLILRYVAQLPVSLPENCPPIGPP